MTTVRVATEALRTFSEYLHGHADTIAGLRRWLDSGRVPTTVWGVPGLEREKYGRAGNLDPIDVPDTIQALPALVDFKNAYEAAHKAEIIRMGHLRDVYNDTAEALAAIADNYDIADGRELQRRSSGRTSARREDDWQRTGDNRKQLIEHPFPGYWRPLKEVVDRQGVEHIPNGYGDIIPVVDAYLDVDAMALKQTAFLYYGVTAEADPVGFPMPNPRGLTGNGSKWEPDQWAMTMSPIPYFLDQTAEMQRLQMIRTVGKSWEGDAFEAFDEHNRKLTEVTEASAHRLRKIGDALASVGDTLSDTRAAVEDELVGAYKDLTVGIGTFEAAKNLDPRAVLFGFVDSIIKVYEAEQAKTRERAQRTRAHSDSSVGLNDKVIAAPSPVVVLREFPFPTKPDEWLRVE